MQKRFPVASTFARRPTALLLTLASCLPVPSPSVAATPAASPPVEVAGPAPVACPGEAPRRTGTTYYVCDCQAGAAPGCVAGNDANAGTRKNAPWRSWSKALGMFRQMNGGDTIAMCRGGSWVAIPGTCPVQAGNGRSQAVTILNERCKPGHTCDWRDYAPEPVFSATALPRVQASPGVEVFAFGRSRFNSTGYSATPVRGLRIMNLDLVGPGDGTSTAFFVYGKTEDLEICGTTIRDGFGAGYSAQTTSTIRRVRFHHNRLVDNPFGIGAINSTSCVEDCVFDSNYLDRNGGATDRDHSIYVGSSPDDPGAHPGMIDSASGLYVRAQRTRITNNEIRNSARGTGNSCRGAIIVVHEPHDDLVIENNLLYEIPGSASRSCFGIQLSSGGDAPGSVSRAMVRRNQLYNVGDKGIAVSECADCVIEDNLVVAGRTSVGVVYPEEPHTHARGSTPSARGVVRNNTIFALPGNPILDAGVRVNFSSLSSTSEGAGYSATNNAVCGARAGVEAGAGVSAAGNRSSVTCPGWFVRPGSDPALADFRPGPGSPLAGSGIANPMASGAACIGAVPWSAGDPGRQPASPPDVGAFCR